MENRVSGTLNTGGRLMDLSVAKVMGIVNVTPDSFFAQSRTTTADSIRRRAAELLAQGADILDVGAYSTRPGGEPVSEQQEMDRLGSALQAVRSECGDVCLSVDTFRPEVARMVVGEFGVAIINDVTGGNRNGVFGAEQLADDTDDDVPAMFRAVAEMGVAYVLAMFRAVAEMGVAYVLTALQPTAEAMVLPVSKKISQLHALGQKDILLDPGFGFGKTVEQNLRLLGELEKCHVFGLPLLVGLSRKSMLWKTLQTTPEEALNATTVANTVALMKGASVLRVHDVRECVEAVKIVGSMQA